MKAEREHIVPLSDAAFELLLQNQPDDTRRKGFIFRNKDSGLSNMAMATVLRRMKVEDVTVHGFRSTFRDWVGDATKHPEDLAELALAHVIKNKAMAAYRRTTAIERRRELMQDWANYLASAQPSSR
jgi:integrase